MGITRSEALKNYMIGGYESIIGASPKLRIYSGSAPAISASATGSLLWEATGASDWLTAASGGSVSLIGTFSAAVSIAGTPGYYRLCTSGGTAHEQGSSITKAFTRATSASTSAGNNVLTFADVTGITAGMSVAGTGVPTGTTVLSVGSSTVTLSDVSTDGVGSSVTIYFGDTSGDLWVPDTAFDVGETITVSVLTRYIGA